MRSVFAQRMVSIWSPRTTPDGFEALDTRAIGQDKFQDWIAKAAPPSPYQPQRAALARRRSYRLEPVTSQLLLWVVLRTAPRRALAPVKTDR